LKPTPATKRGRETGDRRFKRFECKG